MKKLATALTAVSLAAPASAAWYNQGWRTHGMWAGLAGCSNSIPSTNRWFDHLVCGG